jgi:hypothetical protein
MKRNRVWLISLALLGLLVFHEYRSQRAQAASLRSELARLRAQQDRLAIEVTRPALMVRTQAAAGEPSPAEPSRAVGSAAVPASREATADDQAARDQRWEQDARASVARVEDAFAAEPVNHAWAMSTRQLLHDRLTALSRPLASSLRDVECHSSICRVEVVHRDADASRQFATKAFTDVQDQAWNGPVLIPPSQPGPDGSVTVVMYLGREES